MIETVIGSAALAGAALGFLNALYKRSRGVRRFGRWEGGGDVTFTGQVAICIFLGSIGAAFLQRSAMWVIPGLFAWTIGYVSQNRANRRHQMEEEEMRRRNALDHPEVFDNPPPEDINAVPGQRLDLYDAGACTFLGTVDKSDMRAVVDAFAEMGEEGPNDIFLICESLELIPESQMSQAFRMLLEETFRHRDYLVLRWQPAAEHRSV